MKKRSILALIVAVVMMFSFVACSGGTSVVENTVNQAKTQLADLEDSMGGLMTIDMEARGNTIAYIYQYTIEIEDLDAAAEGLDQALASQSSTFESLVQELKTAKVENPSVVVEYKSIDGEIFYSKEFK